MPPPLLVIKGFLFKISKYEFNLNALVVLVKRDLTGLWIGLLQNQKSKFENWKLKIGRNHKFLFNEMFLFAHQKEILQCRFQLQYWVSSSAF